MGGFWAENSLNVGGFLAGVAQRTGFISKFDVFLAIFTPKIYQTHQNSVVLLIINYNCLVNFIGTYHKHGYSLKKFSYKWVGSRILGRAYPSIYISSTSPPRGFKRDVSETKVFLDDLFLNNVIFVNLEKITVVILRVLYYRFPNDLTYYATTKL